MKQLQITYLCPVINKKSKAILKFLSFELNTAEDEIINNNSFFVFLTLFTIIVAFMTKSALDKGEFEFSRILIESLLPLFFILIVSYIFEIVNYKNISNSILVVAIKSLLFSLVPFWISFISTLNPDSGIVNNFYQSIVVLFFVSLYWFLLTTASIIWFKWKAVFVLLLFLFAPGISDLLENTPLKEYSPFEIIMTILEKLATDSSIEIVDTMFLSVYIVSLVIIIKLKKV